MSEGANVKVNGQQKKVVKTYTKVNGTWKTGEVLYGKVNGTWKETWKNALPKPSFLSYPSTIVRGDTITWTTENVTGASYEYQVSYDNGKTWSASQFSDTPTGSYTVSTDITLLTFKMQIRSVAPITHDQQSSWIIGSNVSLTAQTLPAPTGLSYSEIFARGDTIRVYWNVDDANINYVLEVVYADGGGQALEQAIFSNKVSQTGQTYFDYNISTDTKWNWMMFRLYAQKTGYFDSPYNFGQTYQLNGQKLGTVSWMDVPSVQQDSTVTISWGSVTNAAQYMLEVIYDNQTSYTRVYWGPNTAVSFTFPRDHQYIQFRVKATAPYYTDGDEHYAWQYGVQMTPPPLKASTWVTTGTHEWRPNFGGQWDVYGGLDYMMQGQWTDSAGTWGNYKSMALFDYNNIRATLAGKTIVTTKVYLYRISTPHGYHSGQPAEIYTHNYDSHPAGEPSLWYADGPMGSFGLGQGAWLTVSNAVAERIRDGQAAGVGLYSPTGAYYCRFSQNVQLYVEYR